MVVARLRSMKHPPASWRSIRCMCSVPLPLNEGNVPLPLDEVPLRALPQPTSRRKMLSTAMDLRRPEEAYPAARAMRRTIHAHLGPTNSGKTHAALEALRAAKSGVYCGPLRLLAWEIHDQLSSAGVPCELRTGQEVRTPEGGSEHTSCTVEMVSLRRAVEVGVVDEIQMLSHPERGWAWSRAVFGLPAQALHVCGSDDALPLLEALVEACDDALVVHRYERLTPLELASRSLGGDLSKVRPGDSDWLLIASDLGGDLSKVRPGDSNWLLIASDLGGEFSKVRPGDSNWLLIASDRLYLPLIASPRCARATAWWRSLDARSSR